jgi:hypothetical protein
MCSGIGRSRFGGAVKNLFNNEKVKRRRFGGLSRFKVGRDKPATNFLDNRTQIRKEFLSN